MAVARELAPPEGAVGLRLLDHVVVAVVRLAEDEHRRRIQAGVEAIRDRNLLATLLKIPADIPIRADSLSRYDREVLCRAPAGVAEFLGATVTRLLTPPVRVESVFVPGRQWKTGLRSASRFAPYSERTLVLRRLPGDADDLALEASYFGIGVAVHERGRIKSVLDPAPFRPFRFTAASWTFLENVYSTLLAHPPIDCGPLLQPLLQHGGELDDSVRV
jgi:hypothetical protein